MASRIIVLFNLKPGVSIEDYETFARTRDLPTVNALPSIHSFEVYRTTGLLRTGEPAPYQYIEIIDIADMDGFGHDVQTEAMTAIAGAFRELADPVFITTEKLA